MRRRDTPTVEEEARAIVGELRAEISHGLNLEKVLVELDGPERQVLRKVARAARNRRAAVRQEAAAEAALGV